MIEELGFDDLDRVFLNFSSKMETVFSRTYGTLTRLWLPLDPDKFDNATTKTREVGIRSLAVLGVLGCFIGLGAYLFAGAVALGIGSKMFRAAGFYFQKEGFTHVRGAPEAPLKGGNATVWTWPIVGCGKGLYYTKGTVDWRSRVDRIANAIKDGSPDVIVLQQVEDIALMEGLVRQLKDSYAHFYMHLGKTSGCMIITKCATDHFTHTDFFNNDSDANRGFDTFEIKASPNDKVPCARIIGTQLSPGKGAAEKRMEQVAQIVNKLAVQTVELPTLFVGNLVADRDSEEGAYLSKYVSHSYLDAEPTYSNQLESQWAPIFEGQEETRDYISLFKRNIADGRVLPVVERNIRLVDSHLVKAFDENCSTKTALSNSHAVVSTISGLKPVHKLY